MGRNQSLRGRISWRCRYYGVGGLVGEQAVQGITLDQAARRFRNSDLSWRRYRRNSRNRVAGPAVRMGLELFRIDAGDIRNWNCPAGDVGCCAVFVALPLQENRGKRSGTLRCPRPVSALRESINSRLSDRNENASLPFT